MIRLAVIVFVAAALILVVRDFRQQFDKPNPAAAQASSTPTPAMSADVKKEVERAIDAGWVRFDPQSSHRVYVAPGFWNFRCNLEQKEWYAHAFAIYSEHRYDSGYWIDILDNQSGRKLAQFHAMGGFSIVNR